jgi:hypothetical protein
MNISIFATVAKAKLNIGSIKDLNLVAGGQAYDRSLV